MKKFFTLRNVMLLCGALLLVAAFACSFAVKGVLEGNGSHVELQGVLWGSKEAVNGGVVYPIEQKDRYIATLPIIGYILAALGAILAAVFGLALKDEKARKIAVLASAVLALVGAVLSLITMEPATRAYAKTAHQTYEKVKQFFNEYHIVEKPSILNIVMGVLGIVGSLSIAASQFVPEKK